MRTLKRVVDSPAHDDVHEPRPRMLVQLDVDELERMIEAAVERAVGRAAKQPVARADDRLTFAEFCALYRCSARQGRRLIRAGLVRAEKRVDSGSSRVFIRRAEIDRLLAESARP